jgi:serine/threonine-protein kinase
MPKMEMQLQLQPGVEILRGFFLVSYLGSGGFGEVWQAVAPDNSSCALKFINLDRGAVAAKESRALGFMKELQHPYLLSIKEILNIESYLVVCMELAQGTLKDLLRKCQGQGFPGIPASKLLVAMEQAAEGIDYLNAPHDFVSGAQTGRLIHQDIKPQNLLLVGGVTKVADFGLAKLIEQSMAEKSTGAMTPAYAPAEFFRGETAEQSDQ